MLEATLLEDVDPATKLNVEEAFGPVAFLIRFSDFDEALDIVNDSKFGLQAGIFTRDLFQMFDAWDRLEVGGVVINDVPSYRVDNMPYGGVKDSGLGREGVRFAMEDMTEIRNLVIRRDRGSVRSTGNGEDRPEKGTGKERVLGLSVARDKRADIAGRSFSGRSHSEGKEAAMRVVGWR